MKALLGIWVQAPLFAQAESRLVIGAVSGRRFRFGAPGAQVIVDSRDRPTLARVPNLLQVYR